MIKEVSSATFAASPESVEITTLDDVRKIVDCQLRWYGLENVVVKDIKRETMSLIAVTLADLDRNETYFKFFPTTLADNVSSALQRDRMAA